MRLQNLGYAATAYGVQGMTAPKSHTVLSDAMSAAGVYVGLTRGRELNRLHIVAADVGDAREQFQAALERDGADRGLQAVSERAQHAVSGMVADGPVALVNAERARIAERIERAEKQAARWRRAAMRLDRQAKEHATASDAQQAALLAARERAEAARAEVVTPLIEQAASDAATLLAAQDHARDADAVRRGAGRLRRRSAERIRQTAEQDRTVIEATVRDRWGSAPATPERVPRWSEVVAGRQADTDPRVVEARHEAERIQHELGRLIARQMDERQKLHRAVYRDPFARDNAARRADGAAARAEQDRRLLAQIESLPPEQAASLIRKRVEADRIAALALTERAARLGDPEREPHRPTRHGPVPDHGISL